MRGHIRQRSPGRWAIILDAPGPIAGKRKRRWHSFKGTKRQAQVECARLISEAQHGGVDPGRITTGQYLDRWLDHVRTLISPSSHKTYRTMLRAYAVPALGSIQLAKLRPAAIANLYATVALAPKSVALLHRVLSQALRQAVRWQMLPTNPAAAVAPPRIERKRMTVLDPDGAHRLLEIARPTELYMPILLAIMTGMRRGEIVALRWSAINLDLGQLSVVASMEQVGSVTREKPPKSGRARTVALPALVVEELRRHRITQAESLLRLGVRQSDAMHVCSRHDGLSWRPDTLTVVFGRLVRTAGLPRVRFHGLRHAHASHLLAANIHPKVVQERLGHASIALTLDLYSHTVPGMQEEAAASADSLMRAAIKRNGSKTVAKR
jgi:integrase